MGYTVTVNTSLNEVVLPNGIAYTGGDVVVLDDGAMSLISTEAQAALFSSVVFNGGGGGSGLGTVTDVSVASAHGFSGVVADPTVSAVITLSATPNGLLKSNGTTMSAATAGTDYLTPSAGNAVTATNLAGGATFPAYVAPAAAGLTFVGSGTTLVNAALGNAFGLTLTASTTTLGNPSNPVDGQVIRFRITQGSGGSFTLAYGTAYDFGTAGSPTLSTAAGKVDILAFEYVASISKWCCLGSGLGF